MSLSSPSFVAMLEDTSGTVSSGFAWLSHSDATVVADEGTSATFTVIHNQSSVTSIVWQSSETIDGTYSDLANNSDAFNTVSGADTLSLTLSNVDDDGEKYYRCKIVHSAVNYFSNPSRLIVIDD